MKPKKDRRITVAIIAGAAVVFLVLGMMVNPSHSEVHSFTSASDYNQQKDSGCTNSGNGCHGSESSYKDFNTYHPNSECTDCHDYQGFACIPCHAPNKNHECQMCHDGSMKKAPDVVRLTDSFPSGHYRETTHTAVATDMSQAMHATDAGEAGATCKDCHSRDLRKAHTSVPVIAGSAYGDTLGCGECHNDVRAYGQAEVVANWKSRKCEACHKVGGSAPMHSATTPASIEASASGSCADTGSGCHEGDDLHAMHADAPKNCSGAAGKGEPTCHQIGVDALKPTAKTCGSTSEDSCHQAGSSGTYVHKNLKAAHSPKNGVAASDTSFHAVACGRCHDIRSNGTSLITEHSLATSVHSTSADTCRNCHNDPASADAIDDRWAARDSTDACTTCHGRSGLESVHGDEISDFHTVSSGSGGCASSGPGCHPTDDLSEVGTPTTTSNIHTTCLRCHDRTASGGNRSYDPTSNTCGSGRDCHDAYSTTTHVHAGGGTTDGTDSAHHTAGSAQKTDTYLDLASGVAEKCGSCHDMRLKSEHARPDTVLAGTDVCLGCHNRSNAASVVKDSWSEKSSAGACAACHASGGSADFHGEIGPKHIGVELAIDGSPAPGTCVSSGCHTSTDLRKLHRGAGCAVEGCHGTTGDHTGRDIKSCGGGNSFTACHAGFSATNHFVSHNANLTGTVNGITYSTGANVGCFGCHGPDLAAEHLREFNAGLDGTAVTSCRVCHYDPSDPGSGTYSGDAAVVQAIANRDLRCASCHASGSSADTASAVASPHKRVTAENPLPPGKVWSDPADDWKASFEATTGGGHNGLSASFVGASASKRFPITSFGIAGKTYNWTLPPNSGTTAWLKASVLGTAAVSTPESMSHITITCDDCHSMPDDMAGPHGSSVHVGIDPEYSQTEYANPTPELYQFAATGTQRVICMKCHNMEATMDLSVSPGGAPLHSRHVRHDDLPTSDRHHYGEKCIDCHVRIPHAWKRPRLLVRTVETTDGAVADEYPYVPAGYDGLAGIVLRDYTSLSDLRSRYCATNGCHPSPTVTRHPLPSQIPTAPFWP